MIIHREQFLINAKLDSDTLDIWIAEEWLLPGEEQNEVVFSEVDIARARLIGELIDDLGVNTEGVGVVLSLLDQIHSLRKAMSEHWKLDQK
jgi:chaperone modulatory protein CbpM